MRTRIYPKHARPGEFSSLKKKLAYGTLVAALALPEVVPKAAFATPAALDDTTSVDSDPA